MTEQLISFETAVLAKECGFDWNTEHFFDTYGNSHGTAYYDDYANNTSLGGGWFSSLNINQKPCCSRPTQSLLQKWLREEHNIFLWILPSGNDFNDFVCYISIGISLDLINTPKTEPMPIWEDVKEAGLQEALELLKG